MLIVFSQQKCVNFGFFFFFFLCFAVYLFLHFTLITIHPFALLPPKFQM
jgi:hypothetical protein